MHQNFFLTCFVLGLCGCTADKAPEKPKKNEAPLVRFLNESGLKLPSYFSLDELLAYVNADDLKGASRYINTALNVNIRNPCLHLLNGFVYEEMVMRGDTTRSELAGVAYRSAHTLDPSQWLTLYLLGAHELRAGRHKEAQKYLADALILKPNQPDVLYSLAYASYYLHDIPVALSSIARAVALKPKDPHVNRAAAIVFASAGQFNKATKHLQAFEEIIGKEHPDVASVARRIEDWKSIHTQAISKQTAGIDIDVEGVSSKSGEATQDVAAVLQKQESTKAAPDAPTVVLDCYFLNTTEDLIVQRGQNIMEALQISLGAGSASGPTPIANVQRWITTPNPPIGANPPSGSGWTKTFSYEITPYVMNYSLNIANSNDLLVEINSRPTISTVLGKPAYFLDGAQYVGAAAGGSGSSIASVDAGVRVEVTPMEVEPDGQILMDIAIAGSIFINLPATGTPIDNQMIGTIRSNITSTVRAKFGQTVAVGGIYYRDNVINRSGFPLLDSIPLLQYFFSAQVVHSQVHSVVYLVTPRRGGTAQECLSEANTCKIDKPSAVMCELQERGLMALGEYPTMYYILKSLATKPYFADFRSGDLAQASWGFEYSSLSKKIDELTKFVYF